MNTSSQTFQQTVPPLIAHLNSDKEDSYNRSAQLSARIAQKGRLTFREFMEMSLYDAELGYYTAVGPIIGRNGDFYTSCTLSPVFGIVIAKQILEMWQAMGKPVFTIVEYGAGTGALCKSILQQLKTNDEMYAELRYCIIEKSASMRELEKEILQEKVEWINSITDITGFQGCVLSNELLDNFAVHRVVMQEELKEVVVSYEDGFAETLEPAEAELKAYLLELGVQLPKGYHTEINLQALAWLKEIATTMQKGYVLTIDYGYPNGSFYKESRNQGTLLCYYKHQVNDFIYQHIGEQDLTCHVNFSAICHWGAKFGLNECGFTSQCQFLMALGLREELAKLFAAETNVIQAAAQASAISHTLLMDMGNAYKVLIQCKGMDEQQLTGLAYCSSASL
jgi:SAM-dependent MidA family methyltransferase